MRSLIIILLFSLVVSLSCNHTVGVEERDREIADKAMREVGLTRESVDELVDELHRLNTNLEQFNTTADRLAVQFEEADIQESEKRISQRLQELKETIEEASSRIPTMFRSNR